MHFACWKTKARATHSEYIILAAFPLQRWARKRSSVLRYTYFDTLVLHTNKSSNPAQFICTSVD